MAVPSFSLQRADGHKIGTKCGTSGLRSHSRIVLPAMPAVIVPLLRLPENSTDLNDFEFFKSINYLICFGFSVSDHASHP
jgi:hypothetical protein